MREAERSGLVQLGEEMDFGGCNTNPLYLPGGHQEGRARILPEAHGGRVRVKSHKWKQERADLDVTKQLPVVLLLVPWL